MAAFAQAGSESELTALLQKEYASLAIPLPYAGSFDDFMDDPSSVLEFK